ncbi:hypothetical protein SAMN05444008_10692 [Cnuella takakiae]|uniref:Uncharacterized protein n=1 Tax=Cnuella takakiae TaxID=1302690 RepID=A0A1M5A2P7_9BACT|nr:hypothetical protein SAMN05444008_10692 [Cnuella takakiae]
MAYNGKSFRRFGKRSASLYLRNRYRKRCHFVGVWRWEEWVGMASVEVGYCLDSYWRYAKGFSECMTISANKKCSVEKTGRFH